MKKIILVTALVLTILISVLAGTLARYTVSLEDIASGSVIAKEFIFMEDGTDTFTNNVKIAPTETVIWQFGVRNYDGLAITETPLRYVLTFDVSAIPGKSPIEPLNITVKDSEGGVVDTLTGTGILSVTGEFPLSLTGQSDSYIVEIYWPSNDDIDINYAGDNFGTRINVSAVATQITGTTPEEPPEESDIDVLFQAGTPNQWWEDKYNFSVTITNNSDELLDPWSMSFKFNDIVTAYSNTIYSYNGTTLLHRFDSPEYNNPATDTIPPGGSLTFTGQASGDGNPITEVTVNGHTAEVTCDLDKGLQWHP